MGVSKLYLSQIEGAEEDKTTLAQKDIRFARTIQRLQRSVVTELEKIGIVHLYVLGFRGEDLTSFKLKLSNPSKIAELQELEDAAIRRALRYRRGQVEPRRYRRVGRTVQSRVQSGVL